MLEHQNASGGAGWLGPAIPRTRQLARDGPAYELVTKYWMIEALESFAEATPARYAAVKTAVVAHQRQVVPGVGVCCAHRLRHLAELGGVRARLRAPHSINMMFDEDQRSTLGDALEAALMLRSNGRRVG